MNFPIYIIDAFTKKAFAGNPAAVVSLKNWLAKDVMQKIASEMNLSETAFIVPSNGDPKSNDQFGLKWFSPTNEVPLCGHATLASAYAIFNCLGNQNSQIKFETQSGLLLARRAGKNDEGITLDFPSNPPQLLTPNAFSALVEAVRCGVNVKEVFLSKTTKKLLVRFEDGCTRSQLESLRVDTNHLMTLHDGSEVKGIIVTMKEEPNEGDLNEDKYHFMSRYFSPWNGIPEDSVTGSAHTVCGPYWSEVLGKKELYCRQASPRGGDLWLTVRDDERIDISGNATVVLEGKFTL